MAAPPDDITSKFKEIVRSNGITDEVAEVVVKDAGLQGEGFSSQTKLITVKFVDQNVAPLNLFGKFAKASDSQMEMMDDMKAFVKEARFLTEYVTAAKEMCKTKGFEGLADLYANCYYGDTKMIILENLVLDKGYCLLSKSERQDMDAAKFALDTLAKHHAISYAMIQEEGGADNFFNRFPDLNFDAFDKPEFVMLMDPSLKNALNSNIRILENNNVEGRDHALSILNAHKDASLFDKVLAGLKNEENDLLVLNHGDYWNNNMMFLKDKEKNKVIGHKAIDLQVTRYNSPAIDLSYYLFSSVKTEVRLAHLKDLLQHYLKVLKDVSKDLGHPITLKYEELFQTYRRKVNNGFWFSMVAAVGPGVDAINDVDVSKIEIKDWAAVFDQAMQKWIDNNPEYAKKIAEEVVKLANEYEQLSLN